MYFQTDSKLFADECNIGTRISYFHYIVSNYVRLFKHFDSMIVQFVHMFANEIAHVLARVSHSMSDLQK